METPSSSHFLNLRLRLLFLSFGGAGLLRPAPGTWGTLAGMPFVVFLLWVSGSWALFGATLILMFFAKIAIDLHEKQSKNHDESWIVIDEVIGILLACLPAFLTVIDLVTAFALFRLFDALKPGPIGWIDARVPGAWGVLLDDVAAGLLAAACLLGVHYAGGVAVFGP